MGTGVPFNDAYRYMDWLLTVPLLLIEILLVMKLSPEEYSSKAWTLGFGSALMIVSGYYGELVVTGDLTPLALLVLVHVLLPLHCVRTPCRFGSCNRKRERPSDCGQDQDGPDHDCHLLVHLPCCVLVPYVGHQCCVFCGLHPVGLLRVRHHLQVRCWHRDLPDHMRQV